VLSGSGVDPDGDPLTYAWDLDYDSIFETPGQVVTYTWPDNGVFTVTLRVDDGRGGSGEDYAIVTIENMTPTISAGGPYTATVGVASTLEATATDVPSDTLTYDWDLDDDGSFDDGTGSVVTYTWATTGIYTVTVRVDDGDGGIATDETTVNVNTLLPVAWLGASYLLARGRRAAPWQN
jgi:plastocyanin